MYHIAGYFNRNLLDHEKFFKSSLSKWYDSDHQ